MAHKAKSVGLHAAAKTLGRAGGKRGGPARARALSGRARSAIASKGGKARHK